MKLCKDCKWHHINLIEKLIYFDNPLFYMCRHPSFASPVNNKIKPEFCTLLRKYYCGSEGKLWEAKK